MVAPDAGPWTLVILEPKYASELCRRVRRLPERVCASVAEILSGGLARAAALRDLEVTAAVCGRGRRSA